MVRGLNGETVLKLEDVLVGYVSGEPYGYKRPLRLTVSATMERLDRQDAYQTTDHRQVSRPLDLAITYGIWQPSGADVAATGAGVAEALGGLGKYARGWDAVKVAELLELSTWHLNAMSAGCDHQETSHEPCPETGYRYGSAWLVRELPEGFEARVRALFGE